ncbi:MAG: hypothetical protein CMO55_00945 [Verrucomicrobiales bacterium]|nr:hypothetical protein [Verrucomicrobiales bacterium]
MKLFVTAVIAPLLGVIASPLWGQDSSSLSEILSDSVQTVEGKKVEIEELEGKIVGLYFSAHWCGPCRLFTPVLAEFYETHKEQDFEIIFISFDKSNTEKQNYMREAGMKWLTMKGAGNRKAKQLAEEFQVQGFPTLLILDDSGKLITPNGRADVITSSETALERWLETDPS